MTAPRFVQFHLLTSFAGVLLNRDDTGMAKRMPFGGAMRTRISSQFVKNNLRRAESPFAISGVAPLGIRSRLVFQRSVLEPLVALGHDKDRVEALTSAVSDAFFGKADKAAKAEDAGKKKGAKKGKAAKQEEAQEEGEGNAEGDEGEVPAAGEGDPSKTSKFFSSREVMYLRSIVEAALESGESDASLKARLAKEMKANIDALRKDGVMSPDIALFGRMTTGDAMSDMSAALHVAHGMTIHANASEVDFFTAMDDLLVGTGEKGQAMVGETEITSPCLYNYAVLDVRQALCNFQGADSAEEVVGEVARRLTHLLSSNIVGAKRGSTAPYARAQFVMVEMGDEQPRALHEAFRNPVRPLVEEGVKALARHVEAEDAMYGFSGQRLHASVSEAPAVLGNRLTLGELADRVRAAIAA